MAGSRNRERRRDLPNVGVPGRLVDGLEKTLAAASFIDREKDAGLIAQAFSIAAHMDAVFSNPELDAQTVTKTMYLHPHLTGLYRELLSTPAARVAAEKDSKSLDEGSSALASMRAERMKAV